LGLGVAEGWPHAVLILVLSPLQRELEILAARLPIGMASSAYVIAADLADPRAINEHICRVERAGLLVVLLFNQCGLGLSGHSSIMSLKEQASIKSNVQRWLAQPSGRQVMSCAVWRNYQ